MGDSPTGSVSFKYFSKFTVVGLCSGMSAVIMGSKSCLIPVTAKKVETRGTEAIYLAWSGGRHVKFSGEDSFKRSTRLGDGGPSHSLAFCLILTRAVEALVQLFRICLSFLEALLVES